MSYLTFVSPKTQSLTLEKPFDLEGGGRLEQVEVSFRTWGRLNAEGDNALLVCHALTGSSDVDDWWEGLLGPGRALDPREDFVVATNVLGGCYGSTGPGSPAPGGVGSFGPLFPAITIRDQVRVQAAVLKALGVRTLRLVVGGSMGGMQSLEWAVMEPLPVEAVAAIGAPVSQSPWAVGLADAQRRAIRNDPAWKGGRYDPANPPRQGLAVARMIAMCTYRSPGSFQLRFQREKHPAGHFQVESYLRYQGEKLGNRFDPHAYLTLTEAMDSHDLARGRGPLPEVLSGLRPRVLVVGIRSDVLYPPNEVEELADGIPHAELTWIESPHGHDAFLMEQDQLSRAIRSFRKRVSGEPGARPGIQFRDKERRAEQCA